MSRLGRATLAGVVFLFGSAALADEQDDARHVRAKLKAALGAVQTVEGTYRTYFSPNTPGTTSIEPDGQPVPGAVAGPDGLILYSEFDWAWQAAPYREAIDGRWGFLHENRMHYSPAAFFFDGTILRTLSRDSNGGLVKPLDETFTTWRNPLRLMGIGFGFEPRRDLDALLSGGRLVSLPDTPAHLKVLKSDYRDAGQDVELTVWIDTKHGDLPRRIEVLEKARRFVTWRIVNDEIREAAPGVWIVLRGSETGFYADRLKLPGGMTMDAFRKLAPEAQAKAASHAEVIPGTLGLGTQTWIVDPRTLRVNRAVSRARFVLQYPEGIRLFDTTHDPPLQYTSKVDRTPDEWRAIVAEGKQRAQVKKERQTAHAALIGKTAPEFPADSVWINSAPLTTAGLAGKVVLLDFWAEWCGPCRRDLPGLAALHKQRDETGVTIVGVHPAGSERVAIDRVIREFHLEYPIVIDTPAAEGWGTLYGHYAVNRIPHAVVLDRRGRIVATGEPGEMLARARQIVADGSVERKP